MHLTLANRQRSLRVDPAALRLLATALYALASHAEKKPRARGRVPTPPQDASTPASSAPPATSAPPAPPRIKDYEEIRLTLCGDAEISRIHQAVFDDPETTDVITIPYAATPAEPASAEIFVNAALALRIAASEMRQQSDANAADNANTDNAADDANTDNAAANANAAAAELALYIAHGFDHLAGYDDHSARGYDAMRRRELSWLDACEKQGILNTLRKK